MGLWIFERKGIKLSNEISQNDFVAKERIAWQDVVKQLDFMLELIASKADKTIIKDANSKLITAILKHRIIFTQRLQIEFTA